MKETAKTRVIRKRIANMAASREDLERTLSPIPLICRRSKCAPVVILYVPVRLVLPPSHGGVATEALLFRGASV